MMIQIRDIRGDKLIEHESPEEAVKWIKTKAVGFVEVWTLKSSPGPLVRIEPSNQFLKRHTRNYGNKKTPKPERSRPGAEYKQLELNLCEM